MLAKTIKLVSVAGLLLASMSWHSGTSSQLLLDWIVCLSTVFMMQQAVRSREYIWAAVVAGTVLLLNPVVPALTPAGDLILFLFLLAVSPFMIGIAAVMDATVALYPNMITEPYSQEHLHIPESEWAPL